MTRTDHQAWAREVLADPKTAVLDTETTGLRGYVCEVSVYDGNGFLVDTLVNPQAPIERGAQNVHGLSAEMLATAPKFGEIWEELDKVIAARRIIVWNASFDSTVIRREVQRLGGMAVPSLLWECAMQHYSDWYQDMDDAKYMRLNGGHRAGEDCKAVFDRLREMADGAL
jgi:DNA polymerase III epsilon subunit-like protein